MDSVDSAQASGPGFDPSTIQMIFSLLSGAWEKLGTITKSLRLIIALIAKHLASGPAMSEAPIW